MVSHRTEGKDLTVQPLTVSDDVVASLWARIRGTEASQEGKLDPGVHQTSHS